MTIAIAAVFVWLLGLCVGSFLNVVVYRVPLGLSVMSPAWSFCPHCRSTLAWHDNLPLVGWLALRGRCRSCAAPISPQYPLVEGVTGLAFLLVYVLLFVEQSRRGVIAPMLPADAALLAGWLVLVAALIACAAMDIVSYLIDPIITNIAVALGILSLALWPSMPQPDPAAAPAHAATTAMFVASLVMLWLTLWRHPTASGGESLDESDQSGVLAPAASGESPPNESGSADSRHAFGPGALAIGAFVALPLWLIFAARSSAIVDVNLRAQPLAQSATALPIGIAFAAIFLCMLLAGGHQREADHEIVVAIEEESPQARRMALGELLWLTPIVGAGVLAWLAVTGLPAVNSAWQAAMDWTVGSGIRPLAGATAAMHAAVIAAAAGWIVRIFFTLVFGMEAFGVGDIYILAAAGACAGWDIALLGFLLAVGIALLGWLLGHLLKHSTMIPFVPPLALGFLMALWLDRPAGARGAVLADAFQQQWELQRGFLVIAGVGILITAVVVARGVRLLLERLQPTAHDRD